MRQLDEIRILIILKRRYNYNDTTHSFIELSTGLYNSAKYMEEMLTQCNIETKIVVVVDNNEIDREVTLFKPTHVIIEALWVVPEKFNILNKLHPQVKWIVRIHSQLPFIAMEGIAIKWLNEYSKIKNVIIGVNSPEMYQDIKFLIKKNLCEQYDDIEKILYLPNYYPIIAQTKYNHNINETEYINVSCFGAIRPLKNHLLQAFASLKFASKIEKKLKFHINGNRIEQKSEPVLNNLIALFDSMSEQGHELILHNWLNREDFLKLCSTMDIGVQFSLSETFNIVGADLVSQNIPFIGSPEIPWIDQFSVAEPTRSDIICKKLLQVHHSPKFNIQRNQKCLNKYSNKSKNIWLNYFIYDKY